MTESSPQRVHLLAKSSLDDDAVRVTRVLEETGVEVVRISTNSGDEVEPLLAQNLRDIEHLVVCGGDGMFHLAVQVMAQSGVPVGLVPAGSGNDAARALGVPSKLEKATKAAIESARPLDLVRVGTSWAVTVVTAGFSGTVTARGNTLPARLGQAKYTLATLLELGKLRTHGLQWDVEGADSVQRDFSLVAIANTPWFGGGMKICPQADPADGMLDITVVDPVSAVRLATVLPRAFWGGHVKDPHVHTHRVSSFEFETDAPLWADGELLADSGHVVIEAVPNALQFCGRRA